jgi:hypothetical protein
VPEFAPGHPIIDSDREEKEAFMFLFKIGLFTCAFYIGMTVLFEATLWAVALFWGFGMFLSGRHPFLRLGVQLGAIFGSMWLISFSAAWWILFPGLKSRLLVHPN